MSSNFPFTEAFLGRNNQSKDNPQIVPASEPKPTGPQTISIPDSAVTTSFKDYVVSGRDQSLHPKQKKMSMTHIMSTGKQLVLRDKDEHTMVCHYNPETVSETLATDYFTALTTMGVRVERYAFKTSKATTWSMLLLFSDWGDNLTDRHTKCYNTADSLQWIRDTMRPAPGYSWGLVDETGKGEVQTGSPPPVFVNLFDRSFQAYIKQAEIKYMKLNPMTGKPIRAEVGITFLEFTHSTL